MCGTECSVNDQVCHFGLSIVHALTLNTQALDQNFNYNSHIVSACRSILSTQTCQFTRADTPVTTCWIQPGPIALSRNV